MFEPTVTLSEPEEIPLASLAKRMPPRTGDHKFAIDVVHLIEDPSTVLDEMILDSRTILGLSTIYCIFCHVPYDDSRGEQCPDSLHR